MSNPQLHCHQETLRTVMLSGQYSDVTFICQDEMIPVHRLVVCGQSMHFDSEVQTQLNECMKRDTKPCIFFNQYPLEVVQRAVTFLYTGTYEAKASTAKQACMVHLEMHAFARSFGIGTLQHRAQQNLLDSSGLLCTADAILELFRFASTCTDADRFDHAHACDDEEGVCKILAEVACKHLPKLVQEKDFMQAHHDHSRFLILACSRAISELAELKRLTADLKQKLAEMQFEEEEEKDELCLQAPKKRKAH